MSSRPTSAPVGADITPLAAVGVLKRWQCMRHPPGGGGITCSGGTPVACFVRTLQVELRTEAMETLRWRAAVGRWGPDGVGCARPMPVGMTAMLWGGARLEALWEEPEAPPRAESGDRLARGWVATGPPFSVRRRRGRPNSCNTRVKTGLASCTAVERRAWQASRKRLSPPATVRGEPSRPSLVLTWPLTFAGQLCVGALMLVAGLPGCPRRRRRRFRGTSPFRLKILQTVERAGQGQWGWRVVRIASRCLAPPAG